MRQGDSLFWSYSLRFYDDRKTQKTCLDAQNRLGADVNLILFCLFKAQAGHCLNLNALKKANTNVISWRTDVIQPLRQIRKNLKGQPYNLPDNDQAAIRKTVNNLELRTEKFQQQYLETLELESQAAEPKQAAKDNLAAYFQILGANISDPVFINLLRRFDALYDRSEFA